MVKPGIAAYFQCWKHPHATIQSVKHYRAAYPNNTLYLLSDNGYDYTELAKEYNCIYEYSSIVHGGYPGFTRIEDVKLFLDRFAKALDLIEEEWVLLLEDDTIVYGPYSQQFIQCDMNGTNRGAGGPNDGNRFYKKQWDEFIRLFNPSYKDRQLYSGWGGCVLNVPFFKKALATNPDEKIAFLWNYVPDSKLYVTDLVLSFICFINKGIVGDLPEFSEAGWNLYGIKCVNSDKRWVGLPLEDNEKHLVKINTL